jgi:hypothetical protein
VDREKAVGEVMALMWGWHDLQPEFKDVEVSTDEKNILVHAHRIDPLTWRVEITHLHFQRSEAGLPEPWRFICEVKDKPENPRCVRGRSDVSDISQVEPYVEKY